LATQEVRRAEPRPDPSRPSGGVRLSETRRASLALAALALAAAAVLLWATRDTTFMQDEWDFIQGRSVSGADAFLEPHNNHLLAFLVLIYKGLWSIVGLDDYWVWRLVAVALHLTCVALLYVFARRRVGAVVAVAACVPILVLGSAWEDLLIPFNMQWYLSSAALLGILLMTEREGRLADAAIAALLLIALASSSFGPPVAVGVALACLMRRDWRRLTLAAVPMALYVLWFVTYNIGAENQPPTELTASPLFLLHLTAGSVGALLGTPLGIRPVADLGLWVLLIHLATLALLGARLSHRDGKAASHTHARADSERPVDVLARSDGHPRVHGLRLYEPVSLRQLRAARPVGGRVVSRPADRAPGHGCRGVPHRGGRRTQPRDPPSLLG
jgi:hypothetical protein